VTRTQEASASGSVVVVGSINADLISRVAAHPKPGETVLGSDLAVLPGGKGANQAVAAANLGAKVALLGAVGTDEFAATALSGLQAAGVDLTAVDTVPGSTGIAVITVSASGENSIVVIPGANGEVSAQRVTAHRNAISGADVVVVQGEIPAAAIEAAADATTGRLLVNLAPVVQVDPAVLRKARPLVVNEHEALGALQLLGVDWQQVADPGEQPSELAMARLLVDAGVPEAIITLGAAGALVTQRSGDEIHLVEVPAPKVHAVDTTGAGDAFVGALAARLAAGDDLVTAATFAARVGAYAVTGHGAQPSYPTTSDALPEVARVNSQSS